MVNFPERSDRRISNKIISGSLEDIVETDSGFHLCFWEDLGSPEAVKEIDFVPHRITPVLGVHPKPSVEINVLIKKVGIRKVSRTVEVSDMILHPYKIVPFFKVAVINIAHAQIKVHVQFVLQEILVRIGVQRVIIDPSVIGGRHRNSISVFYGIRGPVILIGRGVVCRKKILLVKPQFQAESVIGVGL